MPSSTIGAPSRFARSSPPRVNTSARPTSKRHCNRSRSCGATATRLGRSSTSSSAHSATPQKRRVTAPRTARRRTRTGDEREGFSGHRSTARRACARGQSSSQKEIAMTCLRSTAMIAAFCALLAGCSGSIKESASKVKALVTPQDKASVTTSRRTMPNGAEAPLFTDLGNYHYPVSSRSELAQKYFDQGLTLAYGFNHAEAARSFRECRRLDPKCAMCSWGEAYVLGPNINKPMDEADVEPAWKAMQVALAAQSDASPKERALIAALAKRYGEKPVKDRKKLDLAYANAMRKVARAYPDDVDVQAMFAESLMDTMPWDYYEKSGKPKPATVEVVNALESVMQRVPNHAGAIHFYIHAVEASSAPQRAEAPADRLAHLVPGAGHLVHMPAHIYLRVGRYNDATEANAR